MFGDFDEDEDPDFQPDDQEPYCSHCDSTGFILVCPDDMCRGIGECIHGDGTVVCPDCKGACGDW